MVEQSSKILANKEQSKNSGSTNIYDIEVLFVLFSFLLLFWLHMWAFQVVAMVIHSLPMKSEESVS